MAQPHAVGFLEKELFPSLQKALTYAGSGGRIATLPELVYARVKNVPGAWDSRFTTASSLYFGLSKGGNPIIIVAHGVGPLADLNICKAAYIENAVPVNANRDHFGTILTEEFNLLEAGAYGSVSIVDAHPYMSATTELAGCLNPRYAIHGNDVHSPLIRAVYGSECEAYFYQRLDHLGREKYKSAMATVWLGELRFFFGFSTLHCWANFLALENTPIGASLCDRNTHARFVAVRDTKPITKILEAPRPAQIADRIKGLQSDLDKLRHQIDLMIAINDE